MTVILCMCYQIPMTARTLLIDCVVALLTVSATFRAVATPLQTGVSGESLDLVLEGGAKIQSDSGLRTNALLLDGLSGTYGHSPVPNAWGLARNFRVDLKVRLDDLRGGSVAFGLPGSFAVYFDSQGIPRILLETNHGRVALMASAALTPGRWTDIAFEYRAEDYCLLYVNGRSVASMTGRGPVKTGGKEVWLGRYD